MAHRLLCPSCSCQLNPRDDLILAACYQGKRGLVLLHPEPGNYRVTVSRGLQFTIGDTVDFFCPACQAPLESKLDKQLVQLDFISGEGDQKGFVAFSRVYGEHSTFVVSADTVSTYGESAPAYLQRGLFIGLRPG
jgi:hypothetical protein